MIDNRLSEADHRLSEAVNHAFVGLAPEARVLVAFSGGLDSTVLLHAATRCLGAERVLACHVHHGLQSAADTWAHHCEMQALKMGVTFRLARLGPAQPAGQGVEAWARRERYRALWAQAAETGASALLTAHHADDDAETLLMRLARGAGLEGLAAGVLAEQIGPAGRRLVRPLLSLPREMLADYAQVHGLAFVDDPMNADTAYFRVAIRREVMPALVRAAPAFVANAARARGLLSEAHAVLQEVARTDLDSAVLTSAPDEPPALNRVVLRALSPARRAWLARAWLQQLACGAPTQAQLRAWLAQMVDATSAGGECRLGGRLFMRYRDRIEAWPGNSLIAPAAPGVASSPWPGESILSWRGESVIPLPTWHGCLRIAGGSGPPVQIRVMPAAGDLSLAIAGRRPHRSARKWWQARGVPPPLRPWLPLVADMNGRALYVAGLGTVHTEVCSEGAAQSLTFAFEPLLPADPRRRFVRSE